MYINRVKVNLINSVITAGLKKSLNSSFSFG